MSSKGSFTLGISEEDLDKVGGNASFIGTSGVYDVTIQAVVVDENEHGSISLGFYVALGENKPQMLYGALPLSTYDGKTQLDGNQKTFGALAKLAGLPVKGKFNPVEAELPIGKSGAMKEVLILEDFEGLEVKMWVKQEFYRKGDNSIGDKRMIMRFYRANDAADASELDKPETIGTRFEKDSKYHTDVKYGEGVTQAEAEAYIKGTKTSGAGKGGSTPSATVEVPKSRFAKK